jgi:redox-sensing transcriptional repressor
VKLNHALIERLMHYLQVLVRLKAGTGCEHFSTDEIGEIMGVDASHVRKDMARINVVGRPRVGFSTNLVIETIKKQIGLDRQYCAVIVGSGHLGGALAAYPRFADYGLRLVGAFDTDPARIGSPLGGLTVQPIDVLEKTIRERDVQLAIITVPRDAAQVMTDRLVAAGVTAIWNFAPLQLSVPPHVVVRDEHIAIGLGGLAHHLSRQRRRG